MNGVVNATDPGQDASADGAFTRLLKKMLLKQATIVSVEKLGRHYIRVTLQGDALKNQDWTPGDKIQVSLSRGFENRTYTPVCWDKASGCAEFIAYLHGETSTCAFFDSARSGMQVQFMGPRSSLDLSQEAPALLFGDETCLGLAAALVRACPAGQAAMVFEVGNVAQAEQVLRTLGIADAVVVERRPDDGHLASVNDAMLRLSAPQTSFILAGRAAAIQSVKRNLHWAGVGKRSIRTKAYWAQGKKGLD